MWLVIGRGTLFAGFPVVSFLNPYALLVGLTTGALLAQHGAVYLSEERPLPSA